MKYHRGKTDYYKYLTKSQIRQEKIFSLIIYILIAVVSIIALICAFSVRWEGTIAFCILGMLATDGALLGTRATLLPFFEIVVGEYSNAKPIVVRKKINWNVLLAMGIMIFFGCLLIYVGFDEAFITR